MEPQEMDGIKTWMPALGRSFLLGDFYDCFTEQRIVAGKVEKAVSDIKVENKFHLGLIRFSSNEKWDMMGLNEHVQATIAAGLIEEYRGASKYLDDQLVASQITHVFALRLKSRQESISCSSIYSSISFLKEEEISKICKGATHTVSDIIYGAELYCVLTEELNREDDVDDEVRYEVEEKLQKLAIKMEDALTEHQDLIAFKEQFNQKEVMHLNQMKCRVYADLQSQGVREMGLFDVYKHCLKLIGQVKNPVAPITNAIAVVLCFNHHLKQYRDVDHYLITRLCSILDEMERFVSLLIAFRKANPKANRLSLKRLGEVLNKYKDLIKKSLKTGVIKARAADSNDQEIEKIVNIIEKHPRFKPAGLERWLQFKKAESEITETMSRIKGITFASDKKQLLKLLVDSFEIKYTLVLNIPPVDKESNEILEEMGEYVQYTKLAAFDEEADRDDRLDWHMIPSKRRLVLEKIRGLAQYLEKNPHIEKETQFMITPGEQSNCSYSVYADDQLLKGNLAQLPGAPTGLRVCLISASGRAKSAEKIASVRLEWDCQELGYPHHFCVEYRLKNSSDDWAQRKTKLDENQMTLSFKSGMIMEIRVMADTCIGRSDYSDIIDTETALGTTEVIISDGEEEITPAGTRKIEQPKLRTTNGLQPVSKLPSNESSKTTLAPPTGLEVELATQTTSELTWLPPIGCHKLKLTYHVRYWKTDQDENNCQELKTTSSGCRLLKLDPETSYSVNVVAVSQNGRDISPASQTIELVTQIHQIRVAQTIVKCCKKIGNRNGIDLFAVPLAKSSRGSTAQRFVFGKADGKLQHRTILVMGATGSGKTTLINGMINYIFNVEWEDPFRFQLIQENMAGRSQVDSQTSRITAYDIHHVEGFRIPFSLTIVDTPGYGDTKGLDRDQEITEMVRKFFEDKNGIQELDVIGFVAQAPLPRLTQTQIYIFDSVLSIFGKDVQENINFLLTFADSQVPPVLSAISQAGLPCPTDVSTGQPISYKFNNSGFFCSSRQSSNKTDDTFDLFYWQMGMLNFQNFFSQLATMKTKSLSLTKQVLDERKRLESTVDGLQPLIKMGLAKMEELRKTKQMITNCQAQIDANENVEFEIEVNTPKKVDNLSGYLTNCNKCYVTCHNPCGIPNDDNKKHCWAMDFTTPEDTRSCRICPEKCIWNMHVNQPYRWEYVVEKQPTSSNAIKQKYEEELKKKLTAEELVKVLEQDVESNNAVVLQRVDTVSRCIQQLDAIALRPNPFSTPQYIDLVIDAEQQDKRLGFKERIESLKKLRQMAVITSKVRNNESLLTLDSKDDDSQAADDDDEQTVSDDDGASMTNLDDRFANLSTATDHHKFKNLFFSH